MSKPQIDSTNLASWVRINKYFGYRMEDFHLQHRDSAPLLQTSSQNKINPQQQQRRTSGAEEKTNHFQSTIFSRRALHFKKLSLLSEKKVRQYEEEICPIKIGSIQV